MELSKSKTRGVKASLWKQGGAKLIFPVVTKNIFPEGAKGS